MEMRLVVGILFGVTAFLSSHAWEVAGMSRMCGVDGTLLYSDGHAVCCDSACGYVCSGSMCDSSDDGSSSCCVETIVDDAVSCEVDDPPCVVATGIAEDLSCPMNGVLGYQDSTAVCCHEDCGTCGGTGCAGRSGGSSNCCGSVIVESQVLCQSGSPPCILQSEVTVLFLSTKRGKYRYAYFYDEPWLEDHVEESVAIAIIALNNSDIPLWIESMYSELPNDDSDPAFVLNTSLPNTWSASELVAQVEGDATVESIVTAYGMDLIEVIDYGTAGSSCAFSDPLGHSVGIWSAGCLRHDIFLQLIGYQLGCRSPEDADDVSDDFTGLGHDFSIGDQRFCTMSPVCDNEDRRIPHFSNPSVSYRGVPTGTTGADCASAIRENMLARFL